MAIVEEIDKALERTQRELETAIEHRHRFPWRTHSLVRRALDEDVKRSVRLLRDQRWIQAMVLRGYAASLGL